MINFSNEDHLAKRRRLLEHIEDILTLFDYDFDISDTYGNEENTKTQADDNMPRFPTDHDPSDGAIHPFSYTSDFFMFDEVSGNENYEAPNNITGGRMMFNPQGTGISEKQLPCTDNEPYFG